MTSTNLQEDTLTTKLSKVMGSPGEQISVLYWTRQFGLSPVQYPVQWTENPGETPLVLSTETLVLCNVGTKLGLPSAQHVYSNLPRMNKLLKVATLLWEEMFSQNMSFLLLYPWTIICQYYVIIVSSLRKNDDSQRHDDVIPCTAGNQ